MKEKGVDKRTGVGSPVLLKTGLKVRGRLLVVGVGAELEDATVVTWEGLDGTGPSFPLFGGAAKIGLNMAGAEDTAGAAEAEGLADGLLSVPNRTLGCRVGPGAGGD